jgi:hypothetical protein
LKFGDFITAIFDNTLNDKIVKGPFGSSASMKQVVDDLDHGRL